MSDPRCMICWSGDCPEHGIAAGQEADPGIMGDDARPGVGSTEPRSATQSDATGRGLL